MTKYLISFPSEALVLTAEKKIAIACRCALELCEFMYHPARRDR